MIGVGIGPGAFAVRGRGAAGGGGGGGGQPALAAIPLAPNGRWHPHYSSVTAAGGRITAASDLMGLAAADNISGDGPLAMTDGLGRKFWRFDRTGYLGINRALTFASARDCAVFMVARVPTVGASFNRFFGLGRAGDTLPNTVGALMEGRTASSDAGFLSGHSRRAQDYGMVLGAQMQVMGVASRSGDMTFVLNDRAVSTLQGQGGSNIAGAEIGRYPYSPGGPGGTGWGAFDLYDIIVYDHALTDPQMLAVSQALMSGWAIAPLAGQLVLDGDSITQGTGDVTSFLAGHYLLTEPGTSYVPPGWRVTTVGVSGNKIDTLIARRDANNSWAAMAIPGVPNVVAFEIGRNTWDGSTGSEDINYDGIVAYLNTATTGVLQRGWTVRAMANIATAANLFGNCTDHRARLRSAQFLIDTLSGAGQTYAGKVSVVSTDLIQIGGQTIFEDTDDAASPIYYAGDSTHPSIVGAAARVTGGDTPQHGVSWGL